MVDTTYHSISDGHLECFQYFELRGHQQFLLDRGRDLISKVLSDISLCMTQSRQDTGAIFATQGRKLQCIGGGLSSNFFFFVFQFLTMISVHVF